MKKVLVVVALVALTLVPVFAKTPVLAAGIEAGYPAAGLTVNYDIDEKWDGYATFSFDYRTTALKAAIGGQYKVTDLEIENVKLPVNVGVQVIPSVVFNSKSFGLAALATGAVSYDFAIEGNDFTAYFRAGVGLDLLPVKLAFSGALGCVYHF